FYYHAFRKAGIKPKEIRSLEDLSRLPFTSKDDLRDNYPFGLFAVPPSDIEEIHTSSGTTGKPIVGGYTHQDIELWSEVMARCLACSGTTKDDVVQNAYGYGLFTGGLGVHYGARRIGASVIPISGGNTKRQIMIMQDFGSTILTCTPSYTLYLAEVAAQMGADFTQMKLKAGNFGAEPWSESMRVEIEKKLDLLALDIYGLTEIIGPGVANECEAKNGLHIFEDHFYPEIIDPQTGENLPPGETGELVLTTLTKEAMPLIRYRTRDITTLLPGTCSCGRTMVRMRRISGRTDDMLIIRGVNVFPSQIEAVLMRIEETEPHYQIVVDRKGALDELEVQVEVNERIFSDEIKRLEEIERKIEREIEGALGISVKVKLAEPRSIQRSEGKAKRVIDKRQL
ncbi:MAG: phenylacetate--CoA ligase, partial [candidate division NC10 bacterium]|nr:phenylacetate--CoA ligase [candidate division NC10 bacterium]